MKGILEFDLETDREDFEMAQKASVYYCMLEEIREKLRSEFKYQEKPMTLKQFQDWLFNETEFGDLTG